MNELTQQDPAFYVYEPSYEYIYNHSPYGNYQIIRNGEMRYTYNNPNGYEEILRYTSDLLERGITDDIKLNEAEAQDTLVPNDTAWFEIWNILDDSEEYPVFWELDEAKQYAKELYEKGTTNDQL